MASGRDDFIIAFRSAFLKKKDKQKFSLLSLILLSIVVIILSNINFKPIQFLKIGINEIIYRSSYVISKPENYLKNIIFKFDEHMNLFVNYIGNIYLLTLKMFEINIIWMNKYYR